MLNPTSTGNIPGSFKIFEDPEKKSASNKLKKSVLSDADKQSRTFPQVGNGPENQHPNIKKPEGE